MEGSFVKRLPRKEGFFFFFADCAVVEMVEKRAEGGWGLEEWDDERVRTGKPGDRGPFSTSEGEVLMVELVTAVVAVIAVPTVLVDARDSTDR